MLRQSELTITNKSLELMADTSTVQSNTPFLVKVIELLATLAKFLPPGDLWSTYFLVQTLLTLSPSLGRMALFERRLQPT